MRHILIGRAVFSKPNIGLPIRASCALCLVSGSGPHAGLGVLRGCAVCGSVASIGPRGFVRLLRLLAAANHPSPKPEV